MSARAPDPQISVRVGGAEPPSMALPEGQPIGPLSIGRAGTWRVVGPGVLEEHGFVYFNGADLFLQSADPNSPLTANGAPIPLQWTAVYAPCEIGVGGARLWFGSPEAPPAHAPSYAPSYAPAAPEARGFAPRVQGNDDEESTRLQSIEELQAVAAMRAQRGPASVIAGAKHDPPSQTLKSQGVTGIEAQVLAAAAVMPQAPASVPAPSFGSAPAPSFGAPPVPSFGAPPVPSFGAPPDAPPMIFPGPGGPPDAPLPAPAPEAAPAPAKTSWIGERWREASGPKKALMVLMAPLIWACWVIFTDKPPPPRPSKPAASATANPSATPSAGSPSAGSPSAGSASALPASDPPPSVSAKPSAKAAASSAPSASPSATPASSAKTPQREAADAVAQGAYDKAARLYEELARAHPEVPAYAEAARIMRAKAERR